jgi:small subunit ribosomal protein S9
MPATTEKVIDALGTGRRKTSVARVRIRAGSGKLTINRRELEEYFKVDQDRNAVVAPLEHCGVRGSVDVVILANGGGPTGQAGACMQGIARALLRYDSDLSAKLREKSFLTRDARMKERKKPGLHGARRGTQFSKR